MREFLQRSGPRASAQTGQPPAWRRMRPRPQTREPGEQGVSISCSFAAVPASPRPGRSAPEATNASGTWDSCTARSSFHGGSGRGRRWRDRTRKRDRPSRQSAPLGHRSCFPYRRRVNPGSTVPAWEWSRTAAVGVLLRHAPRVAHIAQRMTERRNALGEILGAHALQRPLVSVRRQHRALMRVGGAPCRCRPPAPSSINCGERRRSPRSSQRAFESSLQ